MSGKSHKAIEPNLKIKDSNLNASSIENQPNNLRYVSQFNHANMAKKNLQEFACLQKALAFCEQRNLKCNLQ